ncbi:hypothetical protein GCM10023195_82720 [Actinoallomurus liliacearum]|uniref:Uncharacterized protein n=1 Tax=Actinoallomurus liliacearum TaxID=1080073 RepID=A0ABP8TYN8_9ACTN
MLITDVPHNVAGVLLPRRRSAREITRLPGLRLEEVRGYGTYITHHIPTGARLIVTDDPSGKILDKPPGSTYLETLEGDALTDQEEAQLRQTPNMSPDAQLLLSGLLCRATTKDPDDTWAIGNWFSDPLWEVRGELETTEEIQLEGSDDHWKLTWIGFPYPGDVAATLTHPIIGIEGAVATSTKKIIKITLGSATLILQQKYPQEKRRRPPKLRQHRRKPRLEEQ